MMLLRASDTVPVLVHLNSVSDPDPDSSRPVDPYPNQNPESELDPESDRYSV